MTIAIQGIKVDEVKITRGKDATEKITGDYSLLSTQGRVLAKQGFNDWNEVAVSLSANTIGLCNKFMEGVQKDIETVLGFTE